MLNKLSWIKKFSGQSTTLADPKLKILVVLLLIDLIIIGLNFYNSWVPEDQWTAFLSIANDDSIGELIQYFKWFSIGILFVYIAIKRSSFSFLSWTLVFLYLLLDDSLAIHENFGGYLMSGFNFEPPFGMRLQDIGELLVSAIAGSFLLIISIFAYKKGSDFYKITTWNMFYLFLALVFFGVVFDVFAVMTYTGNITAFIFDVIEDGGEMIVGSLMLWFAVLTLNASKLPISLSCSVREIFIPKVKFS